MGTDETALVRLWREKREGRSRAGADLLGQSDRPAWASRRRNSIDAGTRPIPGSWSWTSSSGLSTRQCGGWRPLLDGRVEGSDAVLRSKFMLPWSFSEEAAAAEYMPQLQHNMWVVAARTLRCCRSSPVAGSGSRSWPDADPGLYQHLVVLRRSWEVLALRRDRRAPQPFGVDPPKPKMDAIRIVDMSACPMPGAEFAAVFAETRISLSRSMSGAKGRA